MTSHRTISLELADDLLLAIGQAARASGVSPSLYVQSLLCTALDRGSTRIRARADELRLALLLATDWLDLQRRLRASGHVLRLSDAGDLMVHSWPQNRAILPIEGLGHSLADLCLRFAAAFPGELPRSRSIVRRQHRAA